jgi:alpha-mannosidase/mannosylglycerate hydrolase
LIESCSSYAEIKIDIPWELPSTIKDDFSARLEEKTQFPITTYIRIYPKNNRRIDIRTEFVNTAKWHQIRAVFPTGLNVSHEFVKSHFQVFERPVDTPWDFQGPYATEGVYPQHSFMGIYDPDKSQGLCLLNKGLPSYETYRDENKNVIIALNLFRAQGQWVVHLHLNPNLMTPDAQWLNKKIITEYAIFPMKDNWLNSKIPKISEEYIAPLKYEEHWDVFRLERYNPIKNLPPIYSLVEIVKGNIELSTIKKCEFDGTLIIRVYNLNSKEESVILRIGAKVLNVSLVNLNERSLPSDELNQYGQILVKEDNSNDSDWM